MSGRERMLRAAMAAADGWRAISPFTRGQARLRTWLAKLTQRETRRMAPWRVAVVAGERRIPLWVSPGSAVGAALWARGYFDAEGIGACVAATGRRSGAVFLDIGANYGLFSLGAAVVRPGLRVIAVEASPATNELLRRNLAENAGALAQVGSRVELVAAALGASEGEVEFRQRANDSTSSCYGLPGEEAEVVRVPLRRGDAVLAELGVERVEACKIDVEGGELAVLQGLAGTLRRRAIDWLYLEINRLACARVGHPPEALVAELAAAGYTMTEESRAAYARPGWRVADFQFVPAPEGARPAIAG